MNPKNLVEKIYRQFDKRHLSEDPVCFVHQYKEPLDQESAALLCSLFAFGNRKAIQGSAGKILQVLGDHPHQAILELDPKQSFAHLGHRWIRSDDIRQLLLVLKDVLKQFGSVKNLFLTGYHPSDPNIAKASVNFSKMLQAKTHRFLFPSPEGGSACKRLNLFLRWMVRPADGVDLGLWKEISTSKLIVPLDVHLFQFAQKFRISRTKTPNWKMAVDITEFLKTIDSEDPVKFDFAICHYGMSHGWK